MNAPASNESVTDRGRKVMPYVLILTVGLLCHGFILTNDGVLWDGWYWLEWLKARNWPPMVEYNNAQGLPFILVVLAPFAFVGNIVATGMWANFLCLLVESVVLYRLVLRLTSLNRGEALAITLLAQAMPSFSAAQDFPVFALIFFRMLFLIGALLAVLAVDSRTRWRWVLRGAALAALMVSCVTNGALMPFYGGFFLLLLIRESKNHGVRFTVAARRFIPKYPDLFLLPPAALAVRSLLIPQFGWYQNYNKPVGNIDLIATNFWSFFENVLFFHVRNTAVWFLEHPIATLILAAAFIVVFKFAPERMWGHRSTPSSARFAWFGALLLFLAVFPLAIAGKYFAPQPIGETSRHSMLTPIPFAILLFALFRSLLFCRKNTASRWMAPTVGCAVVVLGSQFLPIYVHERAEWIFSRSLLRNAVKDDVVRNSSVILSRDYSVNFEIIYGTYGFALAFDGLTRLVAGWLPENRKFFTPLEIQRLLFCTTAIPNEFKKVDPSGQQVFLEAPRNHGAATDWDIVSRYLSLRYLGTVAETDEFLASLCTIKATVLKPATAFEPRAANEPSEPPPASVAAGNFSNGTGMQMVSLSGGWWAGKFETTQAQYERLMSVNPSLFKDPSRPVECVSWHDATEFCRRLTEMERKAGRLPNGYVYRLPTAEEFDRLLAEGRLDDTVTSVRDLQWRTQPVGSRPPNSLGLHDVVGNVWEWCEDWWDKSRRFKVSKGASWNNTPVDLAPYQGPKENLDWLSAEVIVRLFGPLRRDYPDQGFWDRGFRCVLAQPVPEAMPSLRGVER